MGRWLIFIANVMCEFANAEPADIRNDYCAMDIPVGRNTDMFRNEGKKKWKEIKHKRLTRRATKCPQDLFVYAPGQCNVTM